MALKITTTAANATAADQPKVGGGKGRAFVTFLAGDADYIKGVVGLAKGLRKVKSKYPLVVAILNDVPVEHRRILRSQGCIVKVIQSVLPPPNQTQFAHAYYVINYSKLRIWEFSYEKMVYLDGDIQVFENIDHLFDLPDDSFYAVKDCFCEPSWSKTRQYEIGYCQQCPEKVEWPTNFGDKPPLYFNAGMFVFNPDNTTYHDLLDRLQVTEPTSFAEQDFLNMYFTEKKKYKPIPNAYNLVLAMLWRHPENVELEKVKVVHYCAAGSKPWRYTGKEENMEREDIKMLVKKWWEIYEDETLDYNEEEESVKVECMTETSLEARGTNRAVKRVFLCLSIKQQEWEEQGSLVSFCLGSLSKKVMRSMQLILRAGRSESLKQRACYNQKIRSPHSYSQLRNTDNTTWSCQAFVEVLGNDKASKQLFNISRDKYVTFDGLAKACAKAGGFLEPEGSFTTTLKTMILGKRRHFHFATSISLHQLRRQTTCLGWKLTLAL